jgi:hypothetical protein
MRLAFTAAALRHVERRLPVTPTLTRVVSAVKRGVGSVKRNRMWSVLRK